VQIYSRKAGDNRHCLNKFKPTSSKLTLSCDKSRERPCRDARAGSEKSDELTPWMALVVKLYDSRPMWVSGDRLYLMYNRSTANALAGMQGPVVKRVMSSRHGWH